MNSTDVSRTTGRRFDVCSTDGVSIAVWAEGDGPAIVLVHGSIADHTTFESLVAVLGGEFTTYAMDRRGFGASGDAPGYTIERDFDDVAAVVDAIAELTGGPVALWGHSYGANCAMGGSGAHRQRPAPDPLRTQLGTSVPGGFDRRRRGRPGARRPRRGDRCRVGRHPRDVGRGDRHLSCQPAVAGAARGGADDPERVPRRAGLGLPTRPVRGGHSSDAAVDGF